MKDLRFGTIGRSGVACCHGCILGWIDQDILAVFAAQIRNQIEPLINDSVPGLQPSERCDDCIA